MNAEEDLEKREHSYTVGRNVNWYRHYGRRYGDSLKKLGIELHMTQKSHCWAYTPRKPELKETQVSQYSLQHGLQ